MKNDKQRFIRVGNHLAVDFVNTQVFSHGEMVDQLETFDDLKQWALEIGIELELAECDLEMKDVHRFRSALKILITSDEMVIPSIEEPLSLINQYLLHMPAQKKLEIANEQFSLTSLYDQLTIKQLLGQVASHAAELLVSSQLKQVKSCSNRQCVLIFLDTSRAKKRRWCSMDRCGNRAKAAAFYRANK